MPWFVKIYYGPYEAFGTIKHRIQRIRGLLNKLTELGYEVELIETNLLNKMSVEMFQRQIFTCDIRNLLFNMDCEYDVVCQRAVETIEETRTRMFARANIRKVPIDYENLQMERELADIQKVQNLEIVIHKDTLTETSEDWSELFRLREFNLKQEQENISQNSL